MGTKREQGVFDSQLSRDQIALRLRPYNGEHGREGATFEDQVVIAAVDAKGFRLSMARKPMWQRQATAVGHWEPAAHGSRFNVRIDPVLSRELSAIRFGVVVLLIAFGAVAALMVLRLLDLHLPPVMTWLIGTFTYMLVYFAYLQMLDPIVIRRMAGEHEYRQVEQLRRFVANVLKAREILDDSAVGS